MAIPLENLLNDLVTASRILASEGIVDSFGHISARHPERPDRFLISRVRAAELVNREDIVELEMDCSPVHPTAERLFAERVLHAAVYRLRPDVNSVCHHHAPSVLPFCVSGVPLVPVIHLGATMGTVVPFWDSRDEFGDTNLLVATEAQGLSMARALGSNWTVLLRRHGATVAGRDARECVFRSIYGARNAEVQWRAMQMGQLQPLTPGEALAAEEFNLTPIAVVRTWERWCARASRAD
jgi:HCOMODA/2-hydroxy-3-carboxy-muconic semialdehyde decarboxylase